MEKILEEVLQLVQDAVVNHVNLMETDNRRTISVQFDDDSVKIYSTIKLDNKKDKLIKEFKKYVNSIDQDLFLVICESFKDGDLSKMDKILKKGSVDEIESVITEFKAKARTIIESVINNYKKLLND